MVDHNKNLQINKCKDIQLTIVALDANVLDQWLIVAVYVCVCVCVYQGDDEHEAP